MGSCYVGNPSLASLINLALPQILKSYFPPIPKFSFTSRPCITQQLSPEKFYSNEWSCENNENKGLSSSTSGNIKKDNTKLQLVRVYVCL